MVVVEVSEERDEEGDNVREGAFWVVEEVVVVVVEKYDVCGEVGQLGVV